ncbi:MAG: hypothetical protein COU06_02870 [Candidatus Harrisonbacteria bacterium CG10_big_fil_rev_8_21_14_0_10_38_8]|uniref:Uncharacterized protein n=1 Tax=Candidatus Harrisonbacteria bacterium CG10_big_fil_rev_8_21_14_0_10_38_8 TaxID=1974582 RepID=A0A2M6WJD5_9BACT|nr:MAG: hypothetical protein COU06_02870 [Candidatus Harrisonbacteria bacterium CG10_big_fil_rev_8_21_14_0_10_38_8]
MNKRHIQPKAEKEDDLPKNPLPATQLEGEFNEQINIAIEILGRENVFGPDEVMDTFGVRVDKVPSIPFSATELERAKKLNQILVLRVDKTNDGRPMSIQAMNEILTTKWSEENMGDLLDTAEGWKETTLGPKKFTTEAPRHSWALTTKEVLPGSTDKNYLEQTELLIKALTQEAFKDLELPKEYKDAISEFNEQKEELTKLMGTDWKVAASRLVSLKITKLTRQSAPEALYDLAIYYNTTKVRLLANKYTWTLSLDPDGDLVDLGNFDAQGAFGSGWIPVGRDDDMGASLSRSVI